MSTDKDIVNLALGKLGASAIVSLSPPKSPLEKLCAAGYATWKNSETKKRRWVFATEIVQLTYSEKLTQTTFAAKPYKYAVPIDNLRIIRDKTTEFQQRGMYLYSSYDTLSIEYIRKAADHELPDDFIDLLACRIAFEICKPATDSTNSQQVARTWYKEALIECGRLNSFQLEPDSTTTADINDEWLTARWSE